MMDTMRLGPLEEEGQPPRGPHVRVLEKRVEAAEVAEDGSGEGIDSEREKTDGDGQCHIDREIQRVIDDGDVHVEVARRVV